MPHIIGIRYNRFVCFEKDVIIILSALENICAEVQLNKKNTGLKFNEK